jgi:hypothetical protein
MIKTYAEYQEYKKNWKIEYKALVAQIMQGKKDRRAFKNDIDKCSDIQSTLAQNRRKAYNMLFQRADEKEKAIAQSKLKKAG